MFRRYHLALAGRADAAAATGNLSAIFAAMWWDTRWWVAPLFVVILIGWIDDFSSMATLLLSVALVGACFIGAIVYVPTVYVVAMKRRVDGTD
jgi:hypothetical protein